MSWEILKNALGACADVNACIELSNRVLGAIRARRMINTRQQLPDDNTAAQHQIQEEMDNTAAQHQIQEEMDRLETTIEHLPDDNTAAQHQIQEETKLKQLGNDLWKLKTTMPKMIDLLDRVEWQSHNKAAADLLPYMKDAVYNAEDLLDEFDYYALKVKAEEGARMSGQDHLHGDAFLEFFDQVKEIQGNLDHIHDQSKDLKLNEAPQKFNESIRPETSSFSGEPAIFGREKELKELVQKLGVQLRTRKRNRDGRKMTELPVLPIVGLGGVGKTTMAQQICNDAKVKGHFDSIIWSCVSDEFDIMRLIKEILQHFGQQTSSDNLNVLMKDLARCVESKKFLLVLDDMWDDLLEDDGARWKIFCAPLRDGLEGSTILVTTRSSKVANLVGTMEEHYELKGLQDDVFWDFFKLCAFGSSSSCNDRELERIGKDILPKLKGSPLAAKTLGRLLKMDPTTAHWERILESELWQLEQKETEILPALRLSYMYLPPHLKRCFSICALYPKDYKFKREFLVDIWIAQGYVVEPKDASFHFVELVERSFFQKASGGWTPQLSYEYVVHDLMHDMAQLVSKDECFIVRHASDLDRIPSNVRHLSIFTNGNVSCTELEIICDKKKLRSLVCNESFSRANDFAHLIDCWFRKLLKIRVFSFEISEVRELPESMGNTKHLRYLHLLGSSTFSTLPSSVRSLHHLKTIDARECVFERFPQDFSDVISLQKFQSWNFSYKKDHCDKLYLQWSTPVPDYSDQQTSDQQEQMEALPHWNIQELTINYYKGESCPSWLRPNLLPRLRRLEFINCPNIQSISFFEPLCRDSQGSVSLPADTPCCLKELYIRSCPKINWQGLVALPSSLRRLDLTHFGYSTDQFVNCLRDGTLEDLYISTCTLTSIVVSGAFSSLARLTVLGCHRLLSLDEFLTPDYLPVIKHICVGECDELTSLPVDRLSGFSRLQELSISDCRKLNIQRVMTLPSCLTKLILSECPSIESIEMGSSPALEHLYITKCPDLRSIGGSIALAQIGNVCINDCPGLTGVVQPFRSRGYTGRK